MGAVENTGYSGKPLAGKLGIRTGMRFFVKNPPANYAELIGPVLQEVHWLKRLSSDLDMAHVFVKQSAELGRQLRALLPRLKDDGMIWVSWPKKASKVPTDVTEDTVREWCLPMGLVDVKVCAVDETWSALKLVIRKALRGQHRGATTKP